MVSLPFKTADKIILTSLKMMMVICLLSCSNSGHSYKQLKPQVKLTEKESHELISLIPKNTPSQIAVSNGISELSKGDYSAASNQFNLAIKLDPENSYLHLLNGLAYQLMASGGDVQKVPFAESAYIIALQRDIRNYIAARQLARLYMDNKQYTRAQAYFAHAINGDKKNADLYNELSVASYYARDLKMALWASDKAKEITPEEPSVLRTAAFVNTIAGLDEKAEEDIQKYSSAKPLLQPAAWTERLEDLREERKEGLLQTATFTVPVQSAPDNQKIPQDTQNPVGNVPSDPPSPSAWFECGNNPPIAMDPALAATPAQGAQGDEPRALPALPAPCKDAKLRMALIDVVIIHTAQNQNTSFGINLLDGLQAVLNGSIVRNHTSNHTTDESSPPNATRAAAWSLALGNTTTAGINYSLNIANSADDVNQVIARPTLVALDRQPSQFFSGANLSIALTGQYGGNVVEKPIGVSLSVTPTFVDDDTVMLSVKAARSFFQSLSHITPNIGQSIETSRNWSEASVVMKFDQTLILSGLNEKQNETSADGVPVVKDVPGVQYLFSNKKTANYSRSVLILLTPRRPAYGDQLPPPVNNLAVRPSLDELQKKAENAMAPNSNIEMISQALHANPHYLAYRIGDVSSEYWMEPRSLNKTLQDALTLLYF